jgi:putative ABC transport system ATP-binding protein
MEDRNGNQDLNYAIELRDVHKSFQVGDEELPVLKGTSTAIEPGEFVSILGPSGNGKSTLLNMITGIDRPTQGEILVDGQAVHEMSENELARWRGRQVGIIFQFFQMLPALSLLQNVVLPMEFLGIGTPPGTHRAARDAARRGHSKRHLPAVGHHRRHHRHPGRFPGL